MHANGEGRLSLFANGYLSIRQREDSLLIGLQQKFMSFKSAVFERVLGL